MADHDPPNLNTGTPWTESDICDLKSCIEHREPVEYIADFLCRQQAEVLEKMAELGLEEARRPNRYSGLQRAQRSQ